MQIKITDNSSLAKEEMLSAAIRALEECGMVGEGYAKLLCPVDTGNLRNTVIMSSRITQGTFVSTAKENFIMYYLTMNGDVANAFGLTADELGLIGINSGYRNEERAQIESLVMSGIQFLVEYAEGVVKGTIGGGTAAAASAPAAASTKTASK